MTKEIKDREFRWVKKRDDWVKEMIEKMIGKVEKVMDWNYVTEKFVEQENRRLRI